MPRHSLLTTRVVPSFDWPLETTRRRRLGPGVLGKRGGRISWLRRLWSAPVRMCSSLGRRFRTRRRPPYQEVAPGLLQGRRLSAKEAAWALGDGVVAVVDLAAETSEPALLSALPCLNLPLLPGTRPSAAQLRTALAFIARHRSGGKVLVLCADGGARSRDVIAAYPRFPQKYRSDDSM